MIYQNLFKRCCHPALFQRNTEKKVFSVVMGVHFERWEINQPNMQIIAVIEWL